MTIKLLLLLYIILNLCVFIIYIYNKEQERILNFVKLFKSPIKNVHLTLFNTYLKSKNALYIRVFSADDIIIHEIAHSLCNDIGHTEQFYTIYNDLIQKKKHYLS
jgi:hypothetical protein